MITPILQYEFHHEYKLLYTIGDTCYYSRGTYINITYKNHLENAIIKFHLIHEKYFLYKV